MGAEPAESLVPGGTGFGVLVCAALRVAETRSVAPTVGCCRGVDGFAAVDAVGSDPSADNRALVRGR